MGDIGREEEISTGSNTNWLDKKTDRRTVVKAGVLGGIFGAVATLFGVGTAQKIVGKAIERDNKQDMISTRQGEEISRTYQTNQPTPTSTIDPHEADVKKAIIEQEQDDARR